MTTDAFATSTNSSGSVRNSQLNSSFCDSIVNGSLRALRNGQLELDDVLSILQPFESSQGVINAQVPSSDLRWMRLSCRQLEEASARVEHRNVPLTFRLHNSAVTRSHVYPVVLPELPNSSPNSSEGGHIVANVHSASYAAFQRLQAHPNMRAFRRAVGRSNRDVGDLESRPLGQSGPSHLVQLMRLGPNGWTTYRLNANSDLNNQTAEPNLVVDEAVASWSQRERLPADRVPSEFLCPITHETMRDPVTASDGNSYERRAIERWLQAHNTSPMTNAVMINTTLISNHVLRRIIDRHQDTHKEDNDANEGSNGSHASSKKRAKR